jgi:chromate transporter
MGSRVREEPVPAPNPTQPPSVTRLFLSFLRLGLTAFGGPAMVAHIRVLAVEKRKWLDDETFRNGVALCQTIPGATAMQTSAYVGLRTRGVRGAAASFVGFALPAFVLMLVLSALYARFQSASQVASTFGGLRAMVVALIVHAGFNFGKAYLKRWQDFLMAPVAAVLFWIGFHPILVILACFLLGTILRFTEKETLQERRSDAEWFPVKSVILIVGAATLLLVGLLLLDRVLFRLSLLMLRIDLFAFGGGFASIPLMLHEVVQIRHWVEPKVFMDGIALGQVTPGPIVITATFVGYIVRGVWGALIGTASIFLPSFLLVISAAPVFHRLNSFPLFRKGIAGVLCSFVGLLASAAIRLGTSLTWDLPRIALAVAALAALLFRVNLLWIVLGVVVLSLIFRF